MADWTVIPDTALDPDAPVTSELAYSWRDNPIAITEGAPGAPRIQDAAMGSTPTNAGRDWVLPRNALAQVGAVGTYAFLRYATVGALGAGSTATGAELEYASGEGVTGGGNPSGVWRCMGRIAGSDTNRTSLFLRIS